MTPELSRLILEIFNRQPEPPRNAELSVIAQEILKLKSMRFILGFFLFLALICFITTLTDEYNRVLFLVLGGFSFICSLTPIFYALRIKIAIRNGKLTVAEVESITFEKSATSVTLTALEHGMAYGTWRIPGIGLTDFEVEEPWSGELHEGSRVQLLAAGKKSDVIFPLRLLS